MEKEGREGWVRGGRKSSEGGILTDTTACLVTAAHVILDLTDP